MFSFVIYPGWPDRQITDSSVTPGYYLAICAVILTISANPRNLKCPLQPNIRAGILENSVPPLPLRTVPTRCVGVNIARRQVCFSSTSDLR